MVGTEVSHDIKFKCDKGSLTKSVIMPGPIGFHDVLIELKEVLKQRELKKKLKK